MRSLTLRLLLATALLPLGGCGSMWTAGDPPVAQPAQVKNATPKRMAAPVKVAAPAKSNAVKRPVVAATPASEGNSGTDNGDRGSAW